MALSNRLALERPHLDFEALVLRVSELETYNLLYSSKSVVANDTDNSAKWTSTDECFKGPEQSFGKVLSHD